MILIGLGCNISTFEGDRRKTLSFALSLFPEFGLFPRCLSSFYESEPVGPQDQPKFINAVAQIDSDLDAKALLSSLHAIEDRMGRTRERRWHARNLDLDLLDFKGMVYPDLEGWRRAGRTMEPPSSLILPHPRMHERRFVLEPLLEIAPHWRHPCLGLSAAELLVSIKGQSVNRLPA